MNVAFISDYVKKRSQELGWQNFSMRVRQIGIETDTVHTLEAYTDFYVLLGEPHDISIESDTGAYDLADTAISEQQHEHSGTIYINNLGGCSRSISLVQVTQIS